MCSTYTHGVPFDVGVHTTCVVDIEFVFRWIPMRVCLLMISQKYSAFWKETLQVYIYTHGQLYIACVCNTCEVCVYVVCMCV